MTKPTKPQRDILKAISAGEEVVKRGVFYRCESAGWITYDRRGWEIVNIRLTDSGRAAIGKARVNCSGLMTENSGQKADCGSTVPHIQH